MVILHMKNIENIRAIIRELLITIQSDNISKVKEMIINHEIDIGHRDMVEKYECVNPLSIAIEHSSVEMVKLLLELGADPNLSDDFMTNDRDKMGSPLICAYVLYYDEKNDNKRQSYKEKFYMLLQHSKIDVNISDRFGATLLNYLSEEKKNIPNVGLEVHLYIIKCILFKGANIDSKDDQGQTPLNYAKTESVSEKVIQLLEATSNLLKAAQKNNLQEVAKYLKAGGIINAKNHDGKTVFDFAIDSTINRILYQALLTQSLCFSDTKNALKAWQEGAMLASYHVTRCKEALVSILIEMATLPINIETIGNLDKYLDIDSRNSLLQVIEKNIRSQFFENGIPSLSNLSLHEFFFYAIYRDPHSINKLFSNYGMPESLLYQNLNRWFGVEAINDNIERGQLSPLVSSQVEEASIESPAKRMRRG